MMKRKLQVQREVTLWMDKSVSTIRAFSNHKHLWISVTLRDPAYTTVFTTGNVGEYRTAFNNMQ